MQNGLQLLEQFDQASQLERSRQHFQRILNNDPKRRCARAGLALAQGFQYLLEPDNTELLESADKNAKIANEENTFVALTHVAQSLVLSLKEQGDGAFAEVERALSLDPKNVFAWQMKVRLYQETSAVGKGLGCCK